MKIGLPKGLLFSKYHVFAATFWEEIGAEIVISPDTNKKILDEGTKYCVDEACLSMKVFHGHVAWLKDQCDAIFVPRIMGIKEKEYICPMFCGLPETLINDIPGLPHLIDTPVYSTDVASLSKWAKKASSCVTRDEGAIMTALDRALFKQKGFCPGKNDEGYPLKIALIGHAYHVNDHFVNMNLIKKINNAGVGVVTEEYADQTDREEEVKKLFKKPFWSFAREYYGAAVSMFRTGKVDGIIYISSFACGIDSVVIELIQHETGDFPLLILKLDEHTGEAGLDTRVEAFLDMMKRRAIHGDYLSQSGQCLFCS